MGLFNYDSGIMRFLSRMADLVVLNLLMIVFSLPIVTTGAAITAGHYAALKIRRGEGYVFRNFWKSFKENIKQSTGIWLILVVHLWVASIALNVLRAMGGTVGTVLQGIITGMLIMTLLGYMWIFPVQSKFVNTVKGTIKNSFLLAFKHLFRTLLMVLISAVPYVLLMILSLRWYSILLLFGASLPTYWCAMTYDKAFEKLEDMIKERENATSEEDSETVVEQIAVANEE